MTKPIPCPVGCGDKFASENGAVMHAINKSDETHDDVETKIDGYQRLNSDDDNQQPADDSGQDPNDDDLSRPEFPESDEDDSEAANDETNPLSEIDGCPDCGAELVDFRHQDTFRQDGRMWDTPDDFYCSECGRGWNL